MRPTYLGKCEICKREEIKVSKYSFGEPREFTSFEPPYRWDNEKYVEVELCGTDLHLAVNIRKNYPALSTKEVLDKMREFRANNSIAPKLGKNRGKTKARPELVTNKCRECSSTDTRMVKKFGTDQVYFICKVHDPERVDNIGTSFENMFEK